MRTKALLLSAVLGVAGLSTSLAQVYSVNAVGYVNVTFVNGFTMFANPLDAADNTVGALMPSGVPDFTTIYQWNGAGYDTSTYAFGAWSDPAMDLSPGNGAFLQTGTEFTVTFVGEVMQGTLSNPIPAGFAIKSSMVPQAGLVTTDLGLSGLTDFDTIYQWDTATQNYVTASYAFGAWSPAEPTIAVGEGFFLQSASAHSWDRTFSVND